MKSLTSQYPLRPRGALELFDVSFKLYKKYFWPLWGVSALVCMGTAFGYFFLNSLIFLVNSNIDGENALVIFPLFFLLSPFLYGVVGCCLEAAMDERGVSFRECTKYACIRYKTLLISQFFAVVMTIIFGIILYILSLVFFVPDDRIRYFNTLIDIYFFPFTVLFICSSLYFFGAFTLMPLLICLEYHSGHVLKSTVRSHRLSWSRAKSLIALVFSHAFGFFLLYIALTVFTEDMMYFICIMLLHFMHHAFSDPNDVLFIIAALSSFAVIGTLWSPLYLMSLGTFYLDVRIRKEGFDLEYQLSHPG